MDYQLRGAKSNLHQVIQAIYETHGYSYETRTATCICYLYGLSPEFSQTSLFLIFADLCLST